MGTIDNVYVLNYVVNKQIGRVGGNMVVLFVDLRAAFNSVDRGVLVKTMRRKGIRKGLMRSVEEIVRETRSRVKAGKEMGRDFLRQGGHETKMFIKFLVVQHPHGGHRGGNRES